MKRMTSILVQVIIILALLASSFGLGGCNTEGNTTNAPITSTPSVETPSGPIKDEIGVWRGSTRYFYLDMNGNGTYDGAATERFGPFLSSTDNTDMSLAGDWDGDNYDEIGVWRGATRYFDLDVNGNFTYDGAATERFGPFLSSFVANDMPVAGDWNNDGKDEIGVWRGSTQYFYLDVNGNGTYDGAATERFDPFLSSFVANDMPVAGNWDGL